MRTVQKVILALIAIAIIVWNSGVFEPKPDWIDQVAPEVPIQVTEDMPSDWTQDEFTFSPVARYRISGVVLSKHRYLNILGSPEEKISPYDIALGWGPMSDAEVIDELKITQGNRWYHYSWSGEPPIDPAEIAKNSSNNHLIPADDDVLGKIRRIDTYDVVDISGYLVDVYGNGGGDWTTSRTRTDSGAGSCEIIWVETVRFVE